MVDPGSGGHECSQCAYMGVMMKTLVMKTQTSIVLKLWEQVGPDDAVRINVKFPLHEQVRRQVHQQIRNTI
jgi:hypothetical protein